MQIYVYLQACMYFYMLINICVYNVYKHYSHLFSLVIFWEKTSLKTKDPSNKIELLHLVGWRSLQEIAHT